MEMMKDWIWALGVTAALLLFAGGLKRLLKRLALKKEKRPILELAPSLTNLIYIIAFRSFVDLAPLNPKLARWFDSGFYILGVAILLTLFRRLALIAIDWGARQTAQSPILQQVFIPLIRNLASLFIFFTGGIMVLKHFDYDVMSLLTALGVGSLAVGLAAKEALSNMISGFIVIIDRNLRPGDRVNLGGMEGVVVEIGLRSTRIQTGSGNSLIVPNSDLVNTKLINLSTPTPHFSCSTSFRVSLDAPFEKIQALCFASIESNPHRAQDRKPWVHLAQLHEGHQLIQVGFWIEDGANSGGALSDFHRRILAALKADGIPLVGPVSAINAPR